MGDPDTHGPVRPGPPPHAVDDGDVEWAEYVAWRDREAAAGRDPAPEASARCDAEPWDPEPEERDLGGPLFAEDGAADALPPGPLLAALTEQAVADVTTLSDNELVGVLRATQRQLAREQYKQVLAAAEFGRRRQAEFDDALRRGVPAGCAPGGFPGEELSVELTVSRAEAAHLIDDAIDLTSRLPRTLAGMAAGLVDAARAGWIALYTRSLDPADTARADEILAEAAPELRAEQLARKAAALEMKLNPAAVKARREQARRDNQRVDVRREASGNASLAGRELDVADVLASKAYLDAVASRLRASGLDGSLDRLRALALTDLTQGRDPLNRIQPAADQSAPADPPPVPALINLLVPAGTLLGLSTAPAQAGSWGLLDARRRPRGRRRRGDASADPLVRHTDRAGRHRARARLRPRPAPPPARQPADPPAASTASRASGPPQPHPHPHHPWQLRPRGRRRPLHPKPRAAPPGPRPQRDLRRPRLPEPRRQHRPRPHRAVARRAHRPVQPRPALQDAPSRQAGTRLDRQAIRTWRHPLDAAVRPHARHHPHQVRDLDRGGARYACHVSTRDQPRRLERLLLGDGTGVRRVSPLHATSGWFQAMTTGR